MAKSTRTKKTKEQEDQDASSDPTKEVVRNTKGEIISWDSASKDGKLLKVMFDTGVITNETASEVKEECGQFTKHAARTLGSAIQNLCCQMKKQTKARQSKGSKSKFILSACFVRVSGQFLLSLNSFTHTLWHRCCSGENPVESRLHRRGRHVQIFGRQ